jgi:hypothetical protein
MRYIQPRTPTESSLKPKAQTIKSVSVLSFTQTCIPIVRHAFVHFAGSGVVGQMNTAASSAKAYANHARLAFALVMV